MRWFGNAIPLISSGKKTVKQPVYVSLLKGYSHSNIFTFYKFEVPKAICKI